MTTLDTISLIASFKNLGEKRAMPLPEVIAYLAATVFFMVGLLTGVWKYRQIVTSPTASAHMYVDISHRASLLYAFAALLLAKLAEISQLAEGVEVWAVSAPIIFFAIAIITYIIHGVLQDTDNQLQQPHMLGKRKIPHAQISFLMWLLIIAEIGGTGVLAYGVFDVLLFS